MGVFLLSLFPLSLAVLALLLLLWLVFGILKYRRGRPIPRPLVIATLVTVVIALASYIWPFRPFVLRGRQVRTLANMQVIRAYLDQHYESHGQYPNDLSAVIPQGKEPVLFDGWGTRYFFESRQSSYVLVGLGSDRRKDGSDYWFLRDSIPQSENVAGEWRTDQVASDIGWHRQAGK